MSTTEKTTGFESLSIAELKAINDALLDGLASVCEIERLRDTLDAFPDRKADSIEWDLYPIHPSGEIGGQRFHEAFSYLSRVVFARADRLEELLAQASGGAA